ncbi:MAG: glycosyltransferase [Pseudomonadota bacterium]
MRSMHLIASQTLGGAENFYLRLIHALRAPDHETLAVHRRGAMLGPLIETGVRRHRTSMLGPLDLLGRWHIRHLIRRERPDIVQTYMSRASGMTHVPRDAGAVHIARLGGFYKLKYFRHADHWVGNTHGICDYLVRNGIPAGRVHFISNFVDEGRHASAEERSSTRRALDLPDDALTVMALGRFTRKKGFDVLLDAFARLPDTLDGRPLRLLILGDGDLAPALRRQAGQLGLDARVHWAGWQTETAPFYAQADLFVCPSRHEPLGNVILEAWSHGVAVVSTATDGGTELIQPDHDGLLAATDDAPALAARLREALEHAPARARLAAAGRDTLRARHSREAIVRAYNALYRQALSHRRQV